jgi:hypothetical protein
MKLSYIQIALGVLIVIAAGYIVRWMIFSASFQMEAPVTGDNSPAGYVLLFPEHEALANTARYGSILLLCLGITVLAAGFLQIRRVAERFRKLAVTQLAAGALTTALAFFIGLRGFPTEFVSRTAVKDDMLLRIYSTPGPPETYVAYTTFLAALLGVGVLVIAVTQLIVSKKTTSY